MNESLYSMNLWDLAIRLAAIGLGGALGAVCRYGVGRMFAARYSGPFPLGTLLINLSGSLILGWLLGAGFGGGADPYDLVYLLCGTGFLGGFTTFSTLNVQVVQLARSKERQRLTLYLGATYTLGIGLAFAGYGLGQWTMTS